MLSDVRNHEKSLMDYERFYYNNYEYYNEFETLPDYQNDLSKLRFNLSRKSTTTLVLYDTLSSNYEDPPEREAKPFTPQHTHHDQFIHHSPKTIEDFFYHFVSTYHEHNFSRIKTERENLDKPYEILILYFYAHVLMDEFTKTEEKEYANLSELLDELKAEGRETKQLIQGLFELDNRKQSNQFLERWFAFEDYVSFVITSCLQAENKMDKVENFYLFQYCQYFGWLMKEIQGGYMRSMLLAAVPYTPTVSLLLHPLTLPLKFWMKSRESNEKIIFLNLDGRETYYNIRALRLLPKEVRYISIFKEPQVSQMEELKLENTCEQFQVDADYANINLTHSQLLFRQLQQHNINGTGSSENENILLYPLNSMYLRRQYSKSKEDSPLSERNLPKLMKSADIRWLWEQKIAGEVQEWNPEIIIVSYNGNLDIEEEDFETIMRDLIILSDHRVVLFTNLSQMYVKPEGVGEEFQEEEWEMSKVRLIEEFISKYRDYNYAKIDEERLFNNMSFFIKSSSGGACLKHKERHRPLAKFRMAERIQYLQKLSTLSEFEERVSASTKKVPIDSLFREFTQREKRNNQKQNQSWERMINEVSRDLGSCNMKRERYFGDNIKDTFSQIQEASIKNRLNEIVVNLQEEARLIHGQSINISEEFQRYLKNKKQQLVLSNLEHYRYRRAYVGQEEDRGGRIRCYSLCIEDEEEILLQRYSQVIVDDRKLKIFVVNYKGEEGHSIMQGDINDRCSLIKLQKVNTHLQESLQDLDLENKEEILRVNYSYCFLRDKLYLFWPQEWCVKEQIRRKLLDLSYDPPHENFMLRIQFNIQDKCYFVDHLKWKEPPNRLFCLPKGGCTAVECAENQFYIFGGVYDSRLDYYQTISSICIAEVQEKQFFISQLPKRKDSHLNRPNYLKPKMGYKVERHSKNSEQGVNNVNLWGGFGRSFTNCHGLLSYQNYSIIFQFQGVKILHNKQKNYRIISIKKPVQMGLIGRYFVGYQGEGEEKFSDNVKDWMIAESRAQQNGQKYALTVLEDELRGYDFKANHKRQYLFGWDKTIRDKIYIPHCWSPQLRVLTGGRVFIINTSLRTEKSGNYNIGNYVIPKEQDLISMCLQEDRMWMLANSPVLNSLQSRNSNYILYEGSLANINHLLNRKELLMNEKFQFKNITQPNTLKCKTLYVLQEKIYIVGGLTLESKHPQCCRQDVILEKNKEKFRQKIRKLQCPNFSLQMPNPFVVKYKQLLLLYALGMEQRQIAKQKEGETKIYQEWSLKIETLNVTSTSQASQEELALKAPLKIYHFDSKQQQIVLRKMNLTEPKMVKIIKYNRFSYTMLRENLEGVMLKLKKIDQSKYQKYSFLLNDFSKNRQLAEIDKAIIVHYHCGSLFKELLKQFVFILQQEKRERENLQNEELIKQLRSLFRQLNKHLFEQLISSQSQESSLYQFIMEDSSSRKVKYIAIGELFTTKLKFLRVRFKYEMAICMNQTLQEELFFNTNGLEFQELVQQKNKGSNVGLEEEKEENFRIWVTYKY